jgi:hypothetical protein
MKIAIIGGGWVGCHLAYKLKDSYDVVLFDKNDYLFEETSYKNQNRLHLGFHYPRNHMTREMCKNTFDSFISDYGFLVENVENNLYCVPTVKSVVDFNTYKQIFNVLDKEADNDFENVEGCIKTNEKKIDFNMAKEFFNEKLKDIFVKKIISKNDLKSLSKEYDLVIDATNNQLTKANSDNFYEPTLTLLYRKIKNTPFDALTLMDGPFFSIYPYKDDLYTVTDVEHTPLKILKSLKSLQKFYDNFSSDLLDKKKSLIEEKINGYYKNFLNDYEYFGHFLSTKSKINSASDNRHPVIKFKNNVISCFTGKIQGVYIIEEYVKNYINQHG